MRAVIGHVCHCEPGDAAHDISHLVRVLSNAWQIAGKEGGDLEVIIVAALLHDSVHVVKNSPSRSSASTRSAEYAVQYLQTLSFPEEKLQLVYDAIVSHSFSRGLTPKTLEGKVLQDADRLDALGAVGIARLFLVAGANGARLYSPCDPLGLSGRELDDRTYALDHFQTKLLLLPGMMQTASGAQLALERVQVIQQYLNSLEREVDSRLEDFISRCRTRYPHAASNIDELCNR